MLRALLTALALLGLAQTAAAQPPTAPRVALATFDDEVGLDPHAISDMIIDLRGAGLEEGVDVVELERDADPRDAGACDAACADDLADGLGAAVILSGRITRGDAGIQVRLELRNVGEAEGYQSAIASSTNTADLVAATEKIGRGLLASLRPVTPPPHGRPTVVRRPPAARAPSGSYVVRPGVPYPNQRSSGRG